MKTKPAIGLRVRVTRYDGTTVTGTVRKIHDEHDDVFNDDGEFVRAGPLAAFDPDRWQATVEVDAIPPWWPYGECRRFAPAIADLEPLEKSAA